MMSTQSNKITTKKNPLAFHKMKEFQNLAAFVVYYTSKRYDQERSPKSHV